MKVLDPGHRYRLVSLDGDHEQVLQFVKREGEGYPGNVGHYPGTTMQDVLRCLIDRACYVNRQIPCAETQAAIEQMRTALLLLELRAARRHERHLDLPAFVVIEAYPTCPTCGHIGCKEHQVSDTGRAALAAAEQEPGRE